MVESRQSPQCLKELWRIANLLAQRSRPRVGLFNLQCRKAFRCHQCWTERRLQIELSPGASRHAEQRCACARHLVSVVAPRTGPLLRVDAPARTRCRISRNSKNRHWNAYTSHRLEVEGGAQLKHGCSGRFTQLPTSSVTRLFVHHRDGSAPSVPTEFCRDSSRHSYSRYGHTKVTWTTRGPGALFQRRGRRCPDRG